MHVRASVVLMQCTLAHHIKSVRASCVKFHTLLNNNKGQIRLNLIPHVFTLNMNFRGHQFLVEKSVLNGRNGTVFALRLCGPPSWMRERTRLRIKSRPSEKRAYQSSQSHVANVKASSLWKLARFLVKWSPGCDLWIFKVKYWICHIWGENGTIATKWKTTIAIEYKASNMAINSDYITMTLTLNFHGQTLNLLCLRNMVWLSQNG